MVEVRIDGVKLLPDGTKVGLLLCIEVDSILGKIDGFIESDGTVEGH